MSNKVFFIITAKVNCFISNDFLFINECIKYFKNNFLYTKKNYLKGFGIECAPYKKVLSNDKKLKLKLRCVNETVNSNNG